MSATASPSLDNTGFESAVYSKVSRRIIPFLFFCFVFAYLDRVNVGFAKLQMQQDLQMSDAVYGLGAGIFFLGYFLFEIPCNVALQKVGAKRWLGPIMIVWGIVSALQMFVRGAASLYTIRFILGVVESGFFPGVILYLTFWFPRQRRARMIAAFMTAIPLSGVFGGPISGWILDAMAHTGGLRGWQWLFLMEAIPSVIAGLVTLYYLEDGPQKAKWLTADERAFLTRTLAEEDAAKQQQAPGHHNFSDAFRSGKVWALCFVYFGMVMVNYGVSFWLPQMVKETLTKDPFQVGLLTAIPWTLAVIVMLAVGRHSDQTGERRWHVGITALICSVLFAVSTIPGISGALSFAALSVAIASVAAAYSTFWALPTTILSGTAASAGIAWINSVGNLAGYLSPFLVGKIRDATHEMFWALLMLAGCCLISSLLTIVYFRDVDSKRPRTA